MLHTLNSEKREKMPRKMLDYSGPEYENLYQEILIDSTFTYGKFNPIPYPILRPLRTRVPPARNQTLSTAHELRPPSQRLCNLDN